MKTSTRKDSGWQVTEKFSRENIDSLFTPQRIALNLLIQRRKNKELKTFVRTNLGIHATSFLEKFSGPRAVYFRQVATPSHETLRFLRIAKHLGLPPLILEISGDKFVSARNPYKRALGKLPIYQHTGKDGIDNVRYETVLEFTRNEGKAFSDICIKTGEPLIDFHHRLLRKITNLNPKKYCVDGTPWFKSLGEHADNYYEYVFALFIRDAILFENYQDMPRERSFVHKVIIPAFYKVSTKYRLLPLIVRLLPKEEEKRVFWDSYPKKVERFIYK